MYSETEIQHFLEFYIRFLSFAKCHFHKEQELRADSLAFHALASLRTLSRQELTMSELAKEMMITKQQLTRLINDLESRGFVERIHNPVNRRQVYIRISADGIALLHDAQETMKEHTASMMNLFTPAEQQEIDSCLMRLTELFSRLDGFGDAAVPCLSNPSAGE